MLNTKKQVHLAVSTPCTEAWDTMKPDKNGRFCGSCQKNVIDFTRLSDTEILNYFTDFKGSSCGRFTEKQLNRTIVEPNLSRPQNHWAWALSALLLPTVVASQTEKISVPMEISASPVRDFNEKEVINATEKPKVENDKIKLKGIVKDTANEPIVGASILLKGTNLGVVTDIDGHFEFNLSSKERNNEVFEIVVSFIGYETQELKINPTETDNQLKFVMKESAGMMGDVIVVGGVSKRNFFQRTKYFFRNIFRGR
jgi:hypothetical protein